VVPRSSGPIMKLCRGHRAPTDWPDGLFREFAVQSLSQK
jgi:hypothetical protein